MDQPAVLLAQTINQPLSEQSGTEIGPYQLLQEVGQGGMGVVYMAEQHEPVRRKVALKIIKPGMDTRQVISRFEAEREALSLMDHPNIARVLDAGATDSGRPYFVMELVKGQPITEYCDERHLTTLQRLELLLPVCQAIQHAHQKGIIHRDIKPSNILVAEYDQRPIPKVIDFGVAKAISQPLTEKSMFTGYGQIVGTLEYMSPEQAKVNQLDIDTRSDVYSLGVLMYELLTGTPPFSRQRLRSAAWDEMLRIIREEEPPKPSTRLSDSKDSLPSISAQRQSNPAKLTKLVRGELDWIAMKALEKDRARRYETASDFAADVQHYLNDEPVCACPPSGAYRFRKFARRNKVAIVTLGFVAMSLVLGLIGTSWQAIRATRAEVVASQEREKALAAAEAERLARRAETKQRIIAVQAMAKANQESAIAKAINDFLLDDLLGVADAASQVEMGMEPDADVTLKRLLDRAVGAVDERFANQPQVHDAVVATLARAYHAIGRYNEAALLFHKVLELRTENLNLSDPRTLSAMNSLAVSTQESGRTDLALELSERALRLTTEHLGESHPESLVALHNLAAFYRRLGRLLEAEHLFARGLRLHQESLGDDHPDTLLLMNSLGMLYIAQRKHEQAQAIYQRLIPLWENGLGADHPYLLIAMNNLAGSYGESGAVEQERELLSTITPRLRNVLGNDHPTTLTAIKNLSIAHLRESDGAEIALPLIEELVSHHKVHAPRDAMTRLELAYTQFAQTSCLLSLNRWAEAESVAREALIVFEETEENDWRRHSTLSMLGESLHRQGKLAEAQPLLTESYDRLKAIRSQIPVRAQFRVTQAIERLIRLAEDQGDWDRAAALKTELEKWNEEAAGNGD